jgi:hypothetical protein
VAGDGGRPPRRLPQSLGPDPDTRRLLGRRRGGRCGRHRPRRSRQRRGRLHPHAGGLLRPLRPQAVAGPRLVRATGRGLGGRVHPARRHPLGPRQRGPARRHLCAAGRRSVLPVAAGASVRRGGSP